MTTIARHLIIRGMVQGVWYRNWIVEKATGLELNGWVRNRLDGSVEARVQGDGAAVDRLIALAHDGPPAASVEDVLVGEAVLEEHDGFARRSTC